MRTAVTLWIPSVWLALIGSRPLTLWLYNRRDIDYSEGSPLDMAVYSALIAAALVVLIRRRIDWIALVRSNKWLLVLLVYIAISVLWSPSPFTGFKRYVKLVGMVAMAAVILTEKQPHQALKTVAARCAYVLIPTSILCIKYFPAFGMRYQNWTGQPVFVGVTMHKNFLGQLCLVAGLVLIWKLVDGWQLARKDRIQLALDLFVLGLILQLLIRSNSQTSLVCLLAGASLFLLQGAGFIRRRITAVMVASIAVVSLLEMTLRLSEPVLAFLGRDPTLTGRTRLWQSLLPLARNVWIGTGYESFWTPQIQETLAAQGVQASVFSSHNGFLEVYMNLGLIGLALYLAVIAVAYWNVLNWQQVDYRYSRFAYSLFWVILLYNMAEAGFRGLALIPFFFLVLALDVGNVTVTAAAVSTAERASGAGEQYIPSQHTKSHFRSGWHADPIRRRRGARWSAPDSAGGPARNARGMSTAAISARVRAAPWRVAAIAESEDVQTRRRPVDGTRVVLRRTLRQSHEKT